MKVTALLLVGLICISAFNIDLFEKHKLNFQPNRNIMEVMVQVESQLKTGNPLDTVSKMLEDFKTGVNKEQLAHDDLYARQKGECDSEIGFRQGQVSDASKTLSVATQQLNNCNVQKGKASAELGITQDQLIQFRQHVELLQEVRRVEQENFSRAAVVFNQAINAIEDCENLAQQLLSGKASLAQLTDNTGKMIKHAVHLGKTQVYSAVLASLARISFAQADVDAADVERLVGLLQNLRNNLQDAWTDFSNENNNSIQLFTAQKDRMTANIARLEKSTVTLEDEISNLNGCVATQTAIAQAASNKKSRNQRLLDDANKLCGVFEEEYSNATAGRRQELNVLAELERLVERRINQVTGK